jgi:hypothetical protein
MANELILDIDLSGDAINDLMDYPQLVSYELTTAMNKSLLALERKVKDNIEEFSNTGQLRSSINHQIISPFPNLIGIVGTPLLYGLVMEEGRAAGAPPPPHAAIKLWAVRKLQIAPNEADDAAEAIRWSIAHKGIKGREYFKKSLEASEPLINKLFDAAIARSVQRYNES